MNPVRDAMTEARDWAKVAFSLSDLLDYVPDWAWDHNEEDDPDPTIHPTCIYAPAITAIVVAQREMYTLAGMKLAYATHGES